MKKIYAVGIMALALILFVAQGAWAQGAWTSHKATNAVKADTRADEAGSIYLGQCSYNDYIYEMDGISLSFDARVGVGIKLTREMFKDYIGGSIEAIRVGWDDRKSMAKYECFIRQTHFNNETLAKGSGTVKFGWNEIELDEPLPLPDVDTLCVGFYTDLKKDVCSIPKFYPTGKPNSCFLFNGEMTEDNQEIWYDSRSMGVMPIMIKIVDKTGQFSNLIEVTSVLNDVIVPNEVESAAFFTIANKGSNDINTLEVTSQMGEQTKAFNVQLSRTIGVGSSQKIMLPVYCFGTGETQVKFTKVNNQEPKQVKSKTLNIVGVPEKVSENYVHRPILEFFTSENSYQHPSYFDDLFMTGYEPFKDYMTLICQHTDDKFMIGDPDEAILLQLGLANNDSMKIFIPDMALNRTAYVCSPINLEGTPYHYGVIYPDFVADYYTNVITRPTFASVNVEASLNDAKDKVQIKVNGDIAANVLPEGEHLHLTVYLMENQVESTDQQFWDDKEGIQLGNKYVHYNVIRENLTGLWGNKLDVANGTYTMEFATDVYDDYNKENLSVIAFLSRGDQNAHLERNVINSAETAVKQSETGIEHITTETAKKNAVWYDLGGRRVQQPAKGIYINNGKKIYVK